MDNNASRNAGDLDNSFGVDGKVFPAETVGNLGLANRVLTTKEGKLLITGKLNNGYSIISLNKDGSMNSDFNGNGIIKDTFKNGFFSDGRAAALTSNNEILMSGLYHETNNINYHAFALYRQDGSLNPEFGVRGKVIIPPASHTSIDSNPPITIPLLDGKSLVTSTQILNNGEYIGVLYRLHKNGSIDNTFGDGLGYVHIRHSEYQTTVTSMLLQSDGKLLIAGSVYAKDHFLGYVARYKNDGLIDTTFADKGFFLNTVTAKYDQILSIGQLADEKIVAVGSTTLDNTVEGLLLCLTNDGRLDPEFNDGKPVLTTLDENISALQFLNVGFQSDKKIVVQGNSFGGVDDIFLARYLPSGQPDQEFGNGTGWVRTELGPTLDQGRGMAVQDDDRIVIVGTYTIDDSLEGLRQFALRYLN